MARSGAVCCVCATVFRIGWNLPLRRIDGCRRRNSFHGGYQVGCFTTSNMIKIVTFHLFSRVSESILVGSMILGRSLVFVPSFTAAFVAAHRLFKIIDRQSLIKSTNVPNKMRLSETPENVEYRGIDFRYPTRPDVQILKSLDLSIAEGQTMALVGSSGCGKSTLIQLLQRFYDPDHGRIYIGPDEISSDIPVNILRSKLSIVSQEPVLFDRTISENIAYGDNTRDVKMDEIIVAAKTANVHDFIASLPLV